MKYGYTRPVEIYDSLEQQKLKLSNQVDKLIEESHSNTENRKELNSLFYSKLNDGDHLYITDLCILADSVSQLEELIQIVQEINVTISVENINLTISPDYHTTFIESLSKVIQFQNDIIKFRTKVGMEKAKTSGKRIGRPQRDDINLKNAIEMYHSKKYTLEEIKAETNISRATLYRHLNK